MLKKKRKYKFITFIILVSHKHGKRRCITKIKETASKEVKRMVQVGRKAPDFTAPAYHRGKFINMKLSEYLGKWILLCFYPGDFTFV